MKAPPTPTAKRAKHRPAARPRDTRPWIAFPWVFAAPVVLAACGGTGPASEPTASSSSAIYGGTLDDDSAQNAAVVAIEVGAVGDEEFLLCSGALVAPNVVLTARHCVSLPAATAAGTIECDDNGNSLNGADFGDDEPVADINVFATPSIYQGQTPSATAKAVFHPSGSTLCNGDLALIVLDQNITVAAPLHVRMGGPVTSGESTRAVGYGQNDQNMPIGTRYRKDDLPVLAVGSTVSASQTALGSNEFEVGGESTCNGDSGGPAIDETSGAIVGELSRGQSDCTVTTGHVYTSLAGFLTIFQQAFAVAGGTWTDENGMAAGDGGASSSGGSSGGSGGGSSSSGSGSTSSGGGSGYTGPVNLHSGQGQGCSAAGAPSDAGGPFAALALAALGMLCARSRPRRCKAGELPSRRRVL